MARAGSENFTVASVLLPRRQRAALLALYGYARLVDDTGDEVSGDRLALLDWIEHDLDRAYEGRAQHPLLQALTPALHAHDLPRDPLVRLIDANRQDQHKATYETYAELQAYCHLSADPVGELVLHVLGLATPERIAHSDGVCTALQIAEHLQDVVEDGERGRVYLPLQDVRRFGGATTAPALIAFERERAQALLQQHGRPLIGSMKGRARFAVAGFVGGGRAALQAIAAAGDDVSAGPPRAGGRQRLRAVVRALRA
jgi:squalene synthase HpnC